MKICIDAGHGGNDPGCTGYGKIEKNLTLEYATMIKHKLLNYKDISIIMTRENDLNLSLSERAKISNKNKCDLFLSCHLNAFNGQARGTETIHSIYAKPDFITLCKNIAINLSNQLGIPYRRTFSKQGNNGDYYAVIRETNCKAMIIEALFLDNQQDNLQYNADKISNTIVKTLEQFYGLQLKVPTAKVVVNDRLEAIEKIKKVSQYSDIYIKELDILQNKGVNVWGLINKL